LSFIAELRRRNVFRVGIAYVLLGWVVMQAADFALDLIDAPNWIIQVFFIAGLVGLPFALFFAWAYELTPEGIKREAEVDRSASVTPRTGRRIDRVIIVFLAAAVVLLLADRFFLTGKTGSDPVSGQESVTSAQSPNRVYGDQNSAPPEKSVAVLPFADMSQGGDQEWFADGLAEEILNALVRVPDLQVAARTSSFQYRDPDQSIPEIAGELGVAHVLEGSVRSAGDRVRVTAQLIRAADGFHVWSENYDRDMEDMIAIQEDLARSIAQALQTSMDPGALAAMARVGTQSVTAYQEYLKGLKLRQEALSSATGGEEFLQAYTHFERARELDPGFSSAHVDAADFWKVQMTTSRTDTGLTDRSPREVLAAYHERIDAASRSARSEVDRTRILADQAEVDLRLRESLDLYTAYLEARPNDDNARFSAIFVAEMLGNTDAARELLAPWRERALVDFSAANGFANVAYMILTPVEAADVVLEALRRWPNDDGLLYQAHRTLLWAGRRLEADALADRYRVLIPESSPLLEAREACADGDRARAEQILLGLDPQRGNLTSTIWLIAELLGDDALVRDTLRPLEADRVPYRIAALLGYDQFDPRPYPSLMAILEREGVDRPPPVRPPFACPPPEQTSVAVLAFANMSPDPENEYFADGVSEEILNVLTGLDDLRVIARTSAFSFKGSGATVAEIAEKLDVGYVLEGSVRKAGGRVRVTAQLIDTETEAHLWSGSYDRDLDDIFAVQDEIARAIAGELEVRLTPEQQTKLVSAPTDNLEAYNKYLQGRQLWHSRGERNLQASAELLQEAVRLDPEFAEAWAALADAWLLLPEYSASRSVETVAPARDAVNRALELMPDLPQALTTRAYLRFMHDYQWDDAERDFQRALALDPTYATARQWYGEYLAVRYRDVDAALEQIRQAAELDPLAPVMWNVSGWLASQAGRFEEALGYFRRTLDIEPGFDAAYANRMVIHVQLGNYDAARDALDRFIALSGDPFFMGQAFIDAVADPTQRQSFLDGLATSEQIPSGAADRAQLFMLLGDEERALADLERGLAQGDAYATHVNSMRLYDPLREDPRFQAHLEKLNLWPPPER